MPVRVDQYEKLLIDSGYDQQKTEFLVDGFRNGFDIGYQGNEKVKMRAPNLKFRGVGNEKILWNKVMKEVKEKRYAGPFKEIPFEHCIQLPIGLVPLMPILQRRSARSNTLILMKLYSYVYRLDLDARSGDLI